jgi:hypothetical protein
VISRAHAIRNDRLSGIGQSVPKNQTRGGDAIHWIHEQNFMDPSLHRKPLFANHFSKKYGRDSTRS